jgi:antitoxin PrlF
LIPIDLVCIVHAYRIVQIAPAGAAKEPCMEATVAERGQITLPKAVRDALGLTKGTKLKVELEGGRIVLRKDVGDALSRLRGRIKLPPGVTTDDVMRELRGRAPGDPFPAPDDKR